MLLFLTLYRYFYCYCYYVFRTSISATMMYAAFMHAGMADREAQLAANQILFNVRVRERRAAERYIVN